MAEWMTLSESFDPLQVAAQSEQVQTAKLNRRLKALEMSEFAKKMQEKGMYDKNIQNQQVPPGLMPSRPDMSFQNQPTPVTSTPKSFLPTPTPDQTASQSQLIKGQNKIQSLIPSLNKAISGNDSNTIQKINSMLENDKDMQTVFQNNGLKANLEYDPENQKTFLTVTRDFTKSDLNNLSKVPGGQVLANFPEGKHTIKYDLGRREIRTVEPASTDNLLNEKELSSMLRLEDVSLHDKNPLKRKQAKETLDAIMKSQIYKSQMTATTGTGDLSPETIEALASRYSQTGEIPGMGMGKAATIARTKILNQWARDLKTEGKSVEDNLVRQAAYKASKQELNKLQSQRGPVLAFARNAEKNLRLAGQLSEKVGRTGVPVINRWVLAGKKSIAGDVDTVRFEAALRTGINEFAKVTSSATGGGVTSDTARQEVESMLNSAQTPEQVRGIIDLLINNELPNRMSSYEEQINQVKNAIAGRETPVEDKKTEPLKIGRFTVEVE
jgi:hypothetical protein